MKPTEQIPSEMLAAAKEAAAAKGYCSKWSAEKIAEAALEAAGVPALLAQIASMQAWRDAESADCAALLARIAKLEQDAERYRWLRSQHWSDAPLAVVRDPKITVKLGYDLPSLERLDEAIDTAMAKLEGGRGE